MKTALIIDVTNLYHQTRTKFGSYRINYEKYIKNLEESGHVLTHMYAYSKQKQADVPGFCTVLKALGFKTHFGNVNWNVEMALQLARIHDQIECFVLGSSDNQLGRLFNFANERGIVCKCQSVNIPRFFYDIARCEELGEQLMDYIDYGPQNIAQQLVVRSNVDGNVVKHSNPDNF